MTAAATTAIAGPGLLVDDDQLYLRTLQRSLQRRGLECRTSHGVCDAVALARTGPLGFALIDLRLGPHSGLDLIKPLRHLHPQIRIVLLTGYASVATAVEAIKRGADDYLLKPATADSIVRALCNREPRVPDPQATMIPLHRLEWEHIHQALSETCGNISAAARLLGMHRRSLQRKLAKRPGPERNDGGGAG